MRNTVARLPEWLWAPLAASLLTAVIGATGVLAGAPWLFPSLGPTIFLQVHRPSMNSAQPYNIVIGHALGVLGGTAAVIITGAQSAESVLSSNELSWPRAWASIIALGLTLMAQIPLKASHPPAAATALLISLGGFSLNWSSMAVLAAGIVLTAALGELLRRARCERRG